MVAFGHSLLQVEVPHMKKTLIHIVLALSTLGLSPSPATGQLAAPNPGGHSPDARRQARFFRSLGGPCVPINGLPTRTATFIGAHSISVQAWIQNCGDGLARAARSATSIQEVLPIIYQALQADNIMSLPAAGSC